MGRVDLPPFDSWLGYVTCFGQWDISLCNLSKALKYACKTRFSLLSFYHLYENMSKIHRADLNLSCSLEAHSAVLSLDQLNLPNVYLFML